MDARANISTSDLSIVQQLKSRRERLRISQSEIATSLTARGFRMSQTAMSRIEKGERALTVGEAQAYASLLQTSLEALLTGDVTDELIAGARATIRAADVSRRSALSALEAHSIAVGAVEPAIQELEDVLQDFTGEPETEDRLIRAVKEAEEFNHNYGGCKGEYIIAAAIDQLSASTSAVAALDHHYGRDK